MRLSYAFGAQSLAKICSPCSGATDDQNDYEIIESER
jgi:hypothetical protein